MAFDGRTYGSPALAKVRAELDALDAAGVITAGNACSSVLLVKGEPGEAENANLQDGLMCGPDGRALRAALGALGYAPEDWAALACWNARGDELDPALFRVAITAIDPATVVACDDRAAQMVRNAYAEDLAALQNLEEALFATGYVVRIAGMRALNLGGFEAALESPKQKQLMWARLKLIPPLGEPY